MYFKNKVKLLKRDNLLSKNIEKEYEEYIEELLRAYNELEDKNDKIIDTAKSIKSLVLIKISENIILKKKISFHIDKNERLKRELKKFTNKKF